MTHQNDFPSYSELFGQLNFKKGDEARSVYSPAAYLADLIKLLDDNFDNPDLHRRREDIRQLLLDAENTFSLIPYLDIVNELLEKKVGNKPYDVLKKSVFPFNLPYDLAHERIKKHLHFLGISADEIYRQFSIDVNPDIVAREYLQVSEIDHTLFISELKTVKDIKSHFNLSNKETLSSLYAIPVFLKKTGLSGVELRSLLHQNLDETETPETQSFFINSGLGGYVTLDESEEHLIWIKVSTTTEEAMDFTEGEMPESDIPNAWFERVSRFVRLAKKINLSFADLDLILRSCCENRLDANALQQIAVIKNLHVRYELPIDEICAFFSNINTLGFGADKEPEDLFNRIFNLPFAHIDRKFIKGSQHLPQAFSDYGELTCTGDILSVENHAFRKRLSKALGIAENDLNVIITRFRDKASGTVALSIDQEIDLASLSLIYRISKIAQTLDIRVDELLDTMEVLEKDPFIRKYSTFKTLIHHEIGTTDCFQIISGSDVKASNWLIQILFAVSEWMQQNNFTAGDLQFLQTGTHKNEKAAETERIKKLENLNNLYRQFKPLMLHPDYFRSDLFDRRSARVIHDTVQDPELNLCSEKDQRIVKFNREKAALAATKALGNLKVFRKVDFRHLGLEEKMRDKIFNNLVFKKYIDSEGNLIEENFPENAADFSINNSSVEESKEVFEVIHNIFLEENRKGLHYDAHETAVLTSQQDNGNSELSEFAVFRSDLDGLDLSEVRKTELYDNLIFNGYISEDGTVLQPDFFSEDDNYVNFEANANISVFSASVYEMLSTKMAQFRLQPLKLNSEAFEALQLKESEVNELLENLRFNEYLDVENFIVNKAELLSLDIRDFNLALKFYPHRFKILEAIKREISDFKSDFYRLEKDALNETADEIVAGMIFEKVNANYLREGMMSKENMLFFDNDENALQFNLGNYFDQQANAIVFAAVQRIIVNSQKYRINEFDLQDFDFEQSDLEDISRQLHSLGFTENDGSLSSQKISYFLNINNALDFQLEGFQDYNKDIFFVIHAIAKEIDAARYEIIEKLQTLSAQQEKAVLDSLQEAFEMPASTIKVVSKYLLENNDTIVEAFLPPVLAGIGHDDQLKNEPDSNLFNFTYRRMLQVAALIAKTGLDPVETDIVFRDQTLAEKFPEKLTLPKALKKFDALLELQLDVSGFEVPEGVEGTTDLICIFHENRFWAYTSKEYKLLIEGALLSAISPEFEGLSRVDAAFTDEKGTAWIISGANYFCFEKGSKKWKRNLKTYGKVHSNFDDLERIDASFIDNDGKTYLFSGNQYLRFSESYTAPDEGYPKKIKGNWKNEHDFALPAAFGKSIDAAFQSADDTVYFFKDNKFISSADPANETVISKIWGKVKNNFDGIQQLDACFTMHNKLYCFSGNQVIAYSDSIENDEVFVDEGFPKLLTNWIPGLPDAFKSGIDAIFNGYDGNIHIFKGNHYASFNSTLDKKLSENDLSQNWGKVKNNIAENGVVDAALTGLDGKTYLFSGDQFFRYSGSNYAKADEGYPLGIASNWGGLNRVDAAFVLDGKTYLFGENAEGQSKYVRYSTNDYTKHDAGFPKSTGDNWWSAHFNLMETGFTDPDAVFNDLNGNTFLFKGNQFIAFDNRSRWWSAPKNLKEHWDSIPFQTVDAAFTGKDGKTYLFSKKKYIRYSGKNYSKIDDRYPKTINSFWGKVANNIEKNKKIDAALVLDAPETILENGQEITLMQQYTYLFSGNQFFRYTGNRYEYADEGYPKSIHPNLKNELRFKNLDIKLDKGLDAAFADRRNVYLFKNDNCHIVSDEIYHEYGSFFEQAPTAVFIEKGKVFIQDQNGWTCHNHLEGLVHAQKNEAPAILRKVPQEFQQGLDAILDGADGNTYLFKQGQCYNLSLQKAYPINEEWGRIRNNIYLNNQVDAAFTGPDGKTWLFSGDQFVSYTPKAGAEKVIPQFADENPKPIHEHWGGLNNVDLAFIKDGKTYLFEKPNDKGIFRFVSYSENDFSKPDHAPQMADLSWWNFPAIYIEEGFTNVNAVLFDADNMFLIDDKTFVQYNQTDGVWTYPRPLDRIWREFPFNENDFSVVKTAFKGIDGKTYFFSDEAYISYEHGKFGEIREIKTDWGIMDNNIVRQNRIDAAVTLNGKTTFLFSGNQYVRYSGEDYRFIDENYPKTITENLRKEAGFENLPEQFEERLQWLAGGEDGSVINALVANSRNIYIFEQNNCHVVSRSLSTDQPVSLLGAIRNNIAQNSRVDAAFVNNGHTLLFSGDQYFRYSGTDYEYLDEGYPRTFANLENEDSGIKTDGFHFDLDAAFRGVDGHIYLFKNKDFYRSGNKAAKLPVTEFTGKSNNPFSNPEIPIDAAFVTPDGKTYLFKGTQYIRYSHPDNEFIDEGYPKSIKDNWGNLPVDFEESVDGGFVFEGRTYLIKGDRYVRYSDSNYTAIDAIYPQKIVNRWNGWADFLLNDLKTICQYKQLGMEYSGGDHTLNDLLDDNTGVKQKPYEMLSEIFGWDVEEIKWLKRKNAFLKTESDFEVNFDIELILKMSEIFTMTDKAGSSPSSFYKMVWQKQYIESNFNAAADHLYTCLGLKNSTTDWEKLSKQIHDELNLLKRDALMPYVIDADPAIETVRDLFELLLIDIEMGSSASASKIQEAIAAMQLYFHRYFVNLEEVGKLDEAKREELKTWWKWMRNYRVWEANRKVFLYPENYIRPELRDTKTPAFKVLEQALLQGEIDRAMAEKCFNEYLDEFANVGDLKITGANVYKENNDDVLVLFGHTHIEPMQYYYRTALFSNSGSVIWNNWEKVNISINSTRTFPVFAFGRIMVFWIEIEEVEDANAVAFSENNTAKFDTSDRKVSHKANIKYSFYNHNKQWVNPQVLKNGINLEYVVDAAFLENKKIVLFSGKYVLTSSAENPSGDIITIAEKYPNLPEAFKSGIDAAASFDGNRYFFKDGNCVVNEGAATPIKDLFIAQDLPEVHTPFFFPASYVPNNFSLTEFQNGISATFAMGNTMCLIDKNGGYNFFNFIDGKFHLILDAHLLQSFWNPFIRIITNNLRTLNPVDAIFEDENNVLYLLKQGQYECFIMEGGALNYLKPLEGFPKPIKGNLSFNMDKFFNKLHLNYSTNQDHISLTYTTPKETMLLSGVVKPDLTFEEGELRNDYEKQLVLAWERNNFSKMLEATYDKAINGPVQKVFEAARTKIDQVLAKTEQLIELDGALTILSSELTKESPVKRVFNDALDNAIGKIDQLLPGVANATFRDRISDLKKQIGELKSFFNTNPTKEEDKKKLEKMKTSVAELAAEAKKEITKKPFPDVSGEALQLKNSLSKETEKRMEPVAAHFHAHSKNLDKLEYTASLFRVVWNNLHVSKEVRDDVLKAITNIETKHKNHKTLLYSRKLETLDDEMIKALETAADATTLNKLSEALTAAITTTKSTTTHTEALDKAAEKLVDITNQQLSKLSDAMYNLRENYFGRFDTFRPEFGIQTKTNFTFGEPDWFVFEAKDGTFLLKPKMPKRVAANAPEKQLLHYDIFRLTTTNIPILSNKLFSGGIRQLLNLNTQENVVEKPGFGNGKDIPYSNAYIDSVPNSDHLDFSGANGNYYWEIFFHAPFLIAQSLNNAQKFEEAKEWYEYIFDPTALKDLWKFYPFSPKAVNTIPDFEAQVRIFRNDPFDPHAIARLRQQAYQRTIVMNYIDNLLDWGDMLFRQYTRESINEARMLYVLAYDLLGQKPENLGRLKLSEDLRYSDIDDHSLDFGDIAEEQLTGTLKALPQVAEVVEGTVHHSIKNHYFYIPENELFLDYWNRVEDRLYKIRHSMNILGIKQALPLFEPPIDPMAIVQALGSGASLSQALPGRSVSVPHYRFSFTVYKAKELVQKLNQFGGELLSILEKKDAEELSRIQVRQEGVLLSMMTKVREAHLEEATENIRSLEESFQNAKDRKTYWEEIISKGMLPTEEAQIGIMIAASTSHIASSVLKLVSSFFSAGPDALVGPFIMGTKIGGSNIGQSFSSAAETLESLGEGLSVTGEVLGMFAQHERMEKEWELQLLTAESDIRQLDAQLAAAKIQQKVAQYEIALHEKEIEHNESVSNFMNQKFTNHELYQWMSSKLSGLYFQSYKLAYDMAKYAEKAFQFERGIRENEVHFITGTHWDSMRKGLLAGESLGLDLDRMEQAYFETDSRRLEISKSISLLELDPMAFLQLKSKGICEFNLTEAMFDYDFPGHYCRQIKTISISFESTQDQTINATLTQLNNKTIIEADPKAVQFLLNPKGNQPLSIRNNWKANQQVALSHVDEYEQNNGMFELRFDDDKYLPFEGTGAVSAWRLELNGKKGAFNVSRLVDVVINVKYTALPGGEAFANSVRGALKPYQTVRFFDMNYDFPTEWNAFLDDPESDELTLTIHRDHFQNMASSRITGIFTKFDLFEPANISLSLNNDEDLVLKDSKFLETNGLSIGSNGSPWVLKLKGDKKNLRNINFVVGYKAGA